MIRTRSLAPLAGAACLALAACGPGGMGGTVPAVASFTEPEVTRFKTEAPPGSNPDACYGRDVSPATVETITEQVLLQPAEVRSDGTVIYPAVYKTETQQRIVKERRELWFETPCTRDLTPDFVASLQRALDARGYYRGPFSGEMDARTRAAVRAYQKPQGLDSGIVSSAAARKLGLVAVGPVPEGLGPITEVPVTPETGPAFKLDAIEFTSGSTAPPIVEVAEEARPRMLPAYGRF
ncbi:peptidoglycan-binding domain-containing protein [Anianabacter salinae]|uniref:peptidoglycan-binding domain-containing protein n=1 Tax=Anianabacter salinae TaxID=2851023 RepID=UPI002B2119B3|nr:peptidoglycan-binding domain-containing protein [Anianabacter salinae]MBV0911733.1 peptidoglycan-binding protein [Anianabacter salinae]